MDCGEEGGEVIAIGGPGWEHGHGRERGLDGGASPGGVQLVTIASGSSDPEPPLPLVLPCQLPHPALALPCRAPSAPAPEPRRSRLSSLAEDRSLPLLLLFFASFLCALDSLSSLDTNLQPPQLTHGLHLPRRPPPVLSFL